VGYRSAAPRRHSDLEGLCLTLLDWSAELRLLRESHGLAPVAPRLAHVGSRGTELACRGEAAVTGARGRRVVRPGAEKPAAAGAGRAGRS
jgi:hypothetical protein